MNRIINKVFNGDALDLLRVIPTASTDSVITDAMYGTGNVRYEWGLDPAKGNPVLHWQYHEPIYRECLRVLKPGGVLAWGQGAKFYEHFPAWFGGHRVWPLTRFAKGGVLAVGNIWVVQTREQQPIEFPKKDSLVICNRPEQLGLKEHHPCPKPVEEMAWLIEALTKPGQIVLDCFCGLGSTLVAAQQLGRRWIGCDKSRTYCQRAMKRLGELDEEQRKPPAPPPLNHLDLFAGIGGFALATRLAGLTIERRYFSEIDDHAIKVYKKNFPEAVALGDVRHVKGAELPAGNWLLTGGFPCQDISDGGPRAGINGNRSSLWWEMHHVIGELRPKYVIVENVPPLCRQGLDRVLCGLADIGYDAEWQTVSAGRIGAPHRRDRLWIVAYAMRDGCSSLAYPEAAHDANVGDGLKSDLSHNGHPPWSDWKAITAGGRIHAEPILHRVDDGVPGWLDRIEGLGNAVVPKVAAAIIRRLPLWK